MNEVSEIYDQLFSHESKTRKGQSYPVHKKLIFSKKNFTLLDWLTSKIKFNKDDTVLDAGCGTGHSLFFLHEKYGLMGVGISISEKEVRYASEIAQKFELQSVISFKKSSYDHYKDGSFSKILAIESLKHSSDLKISIKNLINLLSPQGILVICEDFYLNESALMRKQKDLWKAESSDSIEYYLHILNSIGGIKINTFDLTSNIAKRPLFILNTIYSLIILIQKIAPFKYRRNLRTYAGAILLEKLYVLRLVSYKIIIVEKN